MDHVGDDLIDKDSKIIHEDSDRVLIQGLNNAPAELQVGREQLSHVAPVTLRIHDAVMGNK